MKANILYLLKYTNWLTYKHNQYTVIFLIENQIYLSATWNMFLFVQATTWKFDKKCKQMVNSHIHKQMVKHTFCKDKHMVKHTVCKDINAYK